MTSDVFLALVKRVEEHGGPLKHIARKYATGDRVDFVEIDFGAEGKNTLSIDDALQPSVQYQIIGVLKHDLLERRHAFRAIHAHGNTDIRMFTTGVDAQAFTELEAVLKAWLAAAAIEGWTA